MLLDLIRDGRPMTLRQQLRLTVGLSVPAIIVQLSSIIMQYIDAAMVGRIDAEASASIGLISTTTWLFWGFCTAAATGFSVQVAHRIGAGDLKGARMVLQQSLVGTLVFSLLLAILGASISSSLPAWLGGDVSIRRDASVYFFIFSIFLPSCRPEHRSRTEEADPQLCPYYCTDGNGHHGRNGYPYVSVRPSDYRDDDSGRRNPSAGGNGFTHRSFC